MFVVRSTHYKETTLTKVQFFSKDFKNNLVKERDRESAQKDGDNKNMLFL